MTPSNEQTNNTPAESPAPGAGPVMPGLVANLAEIKARLAESVRRAGRRPGDVALVAVSKTYPAESVRAALAAGQRIFGESRVQEALGKIEALAGMEAEWHLIGHLQRNKAAAIVGRFALIHSVDSVRLIEELDQQARARGLTQRILLQLNVSGEASKFGAPPEALPQLLDALDQSSNLRGEGLMTIPPWNPEPEASRIYFRRLRELLAGVGERPRFTPRQLSMGMSGDFEVAIEEGATLVRVGTAIFGARG